MSIKTSKVFSLSRSKPSQLLKPFMCSLKVHSEFLSRTSLNLSVGFQAQEALFSGFLVLFCFVFNIFCVCYEGVGACMWVQV